MTMGTLAGLVVWFTATCSKELSVWQRTVYGALLIWSVAALLAVIVTGHVRLKAAMAKAERYQRELDEAVKSIPGGGDG
jgi:hypothetical protein